MKIVQLIADLEYLRTIHGNVDVMINKDFTKCRVHEVYPDTLLNLDTMEKTEVIVISP